MQEAKRGTVEPDGRGRRHGRPTVRLFARSRSGATTVEFALVSVPFLGLLFAIFQTCLAFLMQQGLRAALDNAARQVLVGTAQNNAAVTSWQTFRDAYVCPAAGRILPSFVTCSNILVDVRPYTNFSSLARGNVSSSFLTDGSGPQYNPGTACAIVVVRAAYPMPVFLPILADANLGKSVTVNNAGLTTYNGRLVQMVTAAAVFRNEPYTTGGAPSSGC